MECVHDLHVKSRDAQYTGFQNDMNTQFFKHKIEEKKCYKINLRLISVTNRTNIIILHQNIIETGIFM